MRTVGKGTMRFPRHLLWGLEKENLRLDPDGRLSDSPHPRELGLPRYSRDFAESQLETITPPATSAAEALAGMADLSDRAEAAIRPERLWNYSMPPAGIEEGDIRIAEFVANPDPAMRPAAREREVLYREGLALRYGKSRQLISGVHLNFSVPGDSLEDLRGEAGRGFASEAEFRNEFYTALAGYLYRKLPVLLLFSAATPFVPPAPGLFPEGRPALSLRNGGGGYAGTAYRPYLNLDSFRSYLGKIREGTETISDIYHFLGTVTKGKATQLNAAVFQQAKEFYAPLRIRCGKSHADPPSAEYLELRIFDINPFEESGIEAGIIDLVQLYATAWIAGPEYRSWLDSPYRYMERNTALLPGALAAFDAVSALDPEDGDRTGLSGRWEAEKRELRPAAEALDRDGGGRYGRGLETLTARLNGAGGLTAERVIRAFREDETFLRTSGSRLRAAV